MVAVGFNPRLRVIRIGFVAERHPMVAVGFNPRLRLPHEWFVAERRLNAGVMTRIQLVARWHGDGSIVAPRRDRLV